MVDLDHLIAKAKELGAAAASGVKTSDIQFSEQFRELCEQNSCGLYDTNWMCPPGVGSFEEAKANVLKFPEGLVFQSVCQIEDSFDFEGMMKGEEAHGELFLKLLEYIRENADFSDLLALNAGTCSVCEKCTFPDDKPCRFPDKAFASVEAHCIDVTALVTSCGIPYNNGPNTVSYVGLYLFK